ncbi:MAG: DNA topoisomerase I [Candidatus Helarchaeota archaeon]
MVITEKPMACKKISEILDEKSNPVSIKIKNVEYYKVQRDGQILLVVPAIGHLITVSHKREEGSRNFEYPVFDLIWIPIYQKLERSRKKNREYYQNKNILDVFKKVSQVCSEYVVACDYDIEGSTIGYNILNYCVGKDKIEKAWRMKFSSLTRNEILKAYNDSTKVLDFNLIEAGLCRHEVDYLFGINLTHALTQSTTKLEKIKFFLLTTGRVQGPTLAEIVKREKQIQEFIPKDYWTIKGKIFNNDKEFMMKHSLDRIFEESIVDRILAECRDKNGKISDIKKTVVQKKPPVPYNLSELQDDAYNIFKYDPSYTLKIAETLYLKSLISYPRTSSQIIPKNINLKQIIESLKKDSQYSLYCSKLLKGSLTPSKGKKTDPAHPPILPTGNIPEKKIFKAEKNIFNLIVFRFFSIFGIPAKFERIKYIISVDSQTFYLSGQKLIEKGWLELNPIILKRTKSEQIPEFKLNYEYNIQLLKEKSQTKPPPRYNPNSIRKWMEKEEIGTKSTRSEIIKKLYERRYIKDKPITPTKIGIALIEILNKYVPEILSIEITRDLENKMNQIEAGSLKRIQIVNEVKENLTKILKKFRKDESNIGKDMEESIIQTYQDQNVIGKCPNCEDGTLKVFYSKKTKKRFIGCSNYPKCTTSFPLSQKGSIRPLKKTCKYCKNEYNKIYPMIRLNLPGKRPFSTCVNWNNHKKSNKSKNDDL